MKRLFIANRGEIAHRIAQSAQHLGIEVVVLTDRSSPPEFLSSVVTYFVKVEKETPGLYLNPQKMIEFARGAGCDALHPGFGFLSENASFASQVQAAGLVWVGPSPQAIDAMASKETARKWAVDAKVPVVPGIAGFSVSTSGDDIALKTLHDFALQSGFPLLLKAAMGGGGKGMRLVYKMEDLAPSAARASSEALSSFADASLICEKYVETSRHVEVQILGDEHGHLVVVGDRDCSVQRRHQKIIEEAPAPNLNNETRKLLHEAALKLAKRVGYTNAGTVEFLLDWSPEAQTLPVTPFYFLEMNTRLQVEHPVSEEIYGIDLVEWQLRIARGERLPDWFGAPERGFYPRGHSVEVRIYAEDPANQFLPAPGLMSLFQPARGKGIRWEIGLDTTDMITGQFDPMIAKLIATASTRQDALKKCAQTLKNSIFFGPPNNTDFLRTILESTPFVEGAQATSFLSLMGDKVQKATEERRNHQRTLAEDILFAQLPALLEAQWTETQFAAQLNKATVTPQQITEFAFKNKSPHLPSLDPSKALATNLDVKMLGTKGHLAIEQNIRLSSSHFSRYQEHGIKAHLQHGTGIIEMGSEGLSGKTIRFWYASMKDQEQEQIWIQVNQETFTKVFSLNRRSTSHHGGTHLDDHEIIAPVPGKIVNILVNEKDNVKAGTVLLVLESMKMEFEIKAPVDLLVDQINVKAGDQVLSAQKLVEFTEKTL